MVTVAPYHSVLDGHVVFSWPKRYCDNFPKYLSGSEYFSNVMFLDFKNKKDLFKKDFNNSILLDL